MTFFTSRAPVAFVAAVLVAIAAAGAVQAQERGTPTRTIGPQGARDNGRSMSEAIRHVQRSTGGQILGAERVQFDGRNINRIKYFDDRGRVRYMDDPGDRGPREPRGAGGGMGTSRNGDGDMGQPPRGDNP